VSATGRASRGSTTPPGAIAATIAGSPAAARRTPYAQAARELLRETLLDAAHDELRGRAWTEIAMRDIARAAGVSRQTLYKEFGSREAFLQALVIREGDRLLAAVEEAIAAHLDDPRSALASAFAVFLASAAENPLVRTIVDEGEDRDFLPLFTTRGAPLLAHGSERLATLMIAGWPHVDREDAERLAECLVRLAISYAGLPGGPRAAAVESVMALLGPYVEQVTAVATSA
jgi:AcrR family transcriptional regulator